MVQVSFRFYVRYFRKNSLARKRETNQYSTAKLSQPKQNMTAHVHWDMVREKVANARQVKHKEQTTRCQITRRTHGYTGQTLEHT